MRQIEPAATRFFNNAGRSRKSEAGLAVHDLSAPCTMPGAQRRRFFWCRPCLAAVRLTAAVLVLAAASLVLVRPAFAADEETFWSATLNVKNVASNFVFGCQNGTSNNIRCSDTSVLTDDDFIVNGVTYEIGLFFYSISADVPEVDFRVRPAPPDNAFDALTLHAGMTALDFADATENSGEGATTYVWHTTLPWSVGTPEQVSITGSGVTATLEPFRTPVESGDSLSHRFDLKLSGIRLAGDSSTNTGRNSRNGLGTLEVPNGNGVSMLSRARIEGRARPPRGVNPYIRAPAPTCTYDGRTSRPIPTSPPVSVRTDRGVTVPARGSDGRARRTRRPANPCTCRARSMTRILCGGLRKSGQSSTSRS